MVESRASRAPTTARGDRRRVIAALLVAAAIAVGIVYRPALEATAIWLDDQQYVTDNTLVLHPSWEAAGRFLAEVQQPSTVAGYYQPLAMISLMLDSATGGGPDHLRAYHRTNLALHIANTVLLIVWLILLFDEPYTAAMIGVLFGVHPLTVEPVSWIAERKTLLATFFSLGALIGYVQYTRSRGRLRVGSTWLWYGGAAVAYLLALLSKPTSTPLPVLFLLLDFWPLRRLDRGAIVEKLPLFALGALAAVVTIVSQQNTAIVQYPTDQSRSAILLVLCYNVVFYLWKIVWPAHLLGFYLRPDYHSSVPMSVTDPLMRAGVVGTVALAVAAATSLLWTRAFFTGWLFYLIALFPTMGVIRIATVIVSEKYAYLPSLGVVLVLAWLAARCWSWSRGTPTRRWVPAAICLVALGTGVAEATATRRYMAFWRDNDSLYGYVHTNSPRAWYLQSDFGDILARAGNNEAAARHYLQAEADEEAGGIPPHAGLQQNLGNALFALGRVDEAVVRYRRALAIEPGDVDTMNDLGLALGQVDKPDEASVLFRSVLHTDPNNAVANNALGRTLANRGNAEQAVAYFRAAIASKPDFAEAYVNLADALQALDRPREAIDQYRKALAIEPNDPNVHNNLAAALLQTGETEGAIAELRVALRLNPKDPDLQANLRAALAARSSPASQ